MNSIESYQEDFGEGVPVWWEGLKIGEVLFIAGEYVFIPDLDSAQTWTHEMAENIDQLLEDLREKNN